MTSERFDNGLKTRKKVLGDEYVERSLSQANDFTMPFQELVTEYCWDHIWNRPRLPHKTRRLLNLAMLCALGRPNELRLHVQGALNNGCTVEEIQEVMLQVSVYCGVPAGNDGFKIAREVIDGQEK